MATHFGLIVERALAAAPATEVSARVRRWSPLELSRLALHWQRANQISGRSGALLHLLAEVLTPSELIRLVPAFGLAEVSNAVGQVDVAKLHALSAQLASAVERAQPAGEVTQLSALTNGPPPTIDWTIEQIFLYYRTNPVGSLSVRAAVWETGAFVGRYLAPAFSIGYSAGTGLAGLLQIFAPELYPWLGQKLHELVEKIHESSGAQPDLGDALYHAAEVIGVEEAVMAEAAVSDGDYQVASGFGNSWCEVRNSCLILERRRELELYAGSWW